MSEEKLIVLINDVEFPVFAGLYNNTEQICSYTELVIK